MPIDRLEFKCGTVVEVDAVFQRPTYYGLVTPDVTTEVNQRTVEARQTEAQRVFMWDESYLFEPPIHHDDQGQGRLPKYCCAAEMTSVRPAHDPNRDFSRGLVVWFQDVATPVVGDYIREKALEVTWEEVGIDGNW